MSSASSNFQVEGEDQGKRVDLVLAARFPHYSRTYLQRLITTGSVLVNGENIKKRALVDEGDEIEITFIDTPQMPLVPEKIPLDLLYEDTYFLAINKPVGLVVHPGAGNPNGTFANALLYHCNQLPQKGIRPGIVHRLDKETSGVLLGAKDVQTQQLLSELFADRALEKVYYAITLGNPGTQLMEAPIGRHPIKRIEMCVTDTGKPAVTKIETVSFNGKLALVKLTPKTGRTHQLRVHLKSLGCPILGDSLYGIKASNEKWHAKRQLLHAYSLSFHHPHTQELLEIKAPFPQDFEEMIQKHFPEATT